VLKTKAKRKITQFDGFHAFGSAFDFHIGVSPNEDSKTYQVVYQNCQFPAAYRIHVLSLPEVCQYKRIRITNEIWLVLSVKDPNSNQVPFYEKYLTNHLNSDIRRVMHDVALTVDSSSYIDNLVKMSIGDQIDGSIFRHLMTITNAPIHRE